MNAELSPEFNGPQLTAEQYLRVASLALPRVDFARSTIFREKIGDPNALAELGTDFLFQTHLITKEELPEVRLVLNGYSEQFTKLSSEAKQEYGLLNPNTQFSKYYSEVGEHILNLFDRRYDPQVGRLRQFLNFVIADMSEKYEGSLQEAKRQEDLRQAG